MTEQSLFWDDLAEDLEDPEFLRTYIGESMRIATVDAIVNALDDAREVAGISKADLARAINVEPATVRRLLGASSPNPTLGTVSELAAALGLKVTIQPMSARERRAVSEPLLEGRSADTKGLARHLTEVRKPKPRSHMKTSA